jgi:flagellar basal-body rod protein FlgG
MGAFVDSASLILAQSERRVEMAGQNLANLLTPGFKRRTSFASLVSSTSPSAPMASAIDFSAGKPMQTKSPYDLAIAGDGFFTVRTGDGVLYTRQGQFRRQADGRIVTAQGYALQTEDGGDLVVQGDDFQVLDDGSVLEAGQPVGRLAIADFTDRQAASQVDGGMFSAPESAMTKVAAPVVRQGALEASNVSAGQEMVTIMEALRQAETGQRLAGVWDDLMGRALNVFGQQA